MANEGNSTHDMIRVLAEQAYRHHLLAKLLVERGYLRHGELDSRWDAEEWKDFLRNFYGAYFPGVIQPGE